LELAEGVSVEDVKESIARDIQQMREIREDVRFGPSTGSLVEEAVNRGIPYIRLNEQSLVQLGYGVYQKRIQATTTQNTNKITVAIAAEQPETKQHKRDKGPPCPPRDKVR